MTKSEINKFKMMLATKQTELSPHLRMRDGIAIEKTPDALDEVQLAAGREMTTRTLERESKILRGVRAALDRIEEGTYGVCENCEEEIDLKRLNAVPWAALCIVCQEQNERDDQRFDHAKWLLPRAA